MATHNQRGLGTLRIGCPEDCDTDIDAAQLLAVVEDCVREMIGGVVAAFADLGDNAFVSARQENLESIHQHNVVAERFGLLGELRSELATGDPAPHHVSMREWLDGAAG